MRPDRQWGDPELLAAVAGGDLGALRVLYDRNAPWLSVRLTRRCNNPEVVADVLQDTFLALWKGAERWRGDGEVAAWLWGIAARRLVSRLRGTVRRWCFRWRRWPRRGLRSPALRSGCCGSGASASHTLPVVLRLLITLAVLAVASLGLAAAADPTRIPL
jgi:DNA-directed RNA polymerase specialized sigma24 family protein